MSKSPPPPAITWTAFAFLCIAFFGNYYVYDSIGPVADLLQKQDRIIRGFPEVESVFGKAGRAETSTDSAPKPTSSSTS